jgi:PhnB protein
MATLLNPYLNFRGKTREAMQFYQEVFGGELTISTFAELHGSMDPSEDELIMHSDLQGPDGIRFMAADVPSRMEYAPGANNFSMSLSGEDEAQLRGYFDKLSAGGNVLMPLEKAAWGDTFGMCTDQFGVTWLVNVNAPRE